MIYILLTIVLFIISCEDKDVTVEESFSEILFIASEGSFGESDGSISIFKDNNKIQTIENIGANVQSLLVDKDKLFVAITGSNKIIRYNITETGLALPGITIQTNNSGPRNMVIIGDELFFTNLHTKDIKIFNLITFTIEDSIALNGSPENIIYHNNAIWVSVPYLNYPDEGRGTTVVKIQPNNRTIEETYNVGRGPYDLLLDNEILWISRTWYADGWTEAYHGSSNINTETGEITIIEYGLGVVCGGNLMKLNNEIYRSWDGGVVPLNSNLELNSSRKIGSYSNLYSSFSANQSLYLGTTDYFTPDTVFVHNSDGSLLQMLPVGGNPGDYAIWNID